MCVGMAGMDTVSDDSEKARSSLFVSILTHAKTEENIVTLKVDN
jgi:hypothetical protein